MGDWVCSGFLLISENITLVTRDLYGIGRNSFPIFIDPPPPLQ